MADYPDYWDQVDLENEIDAQGYCGTLGRGRGRRRVLQISQNMADYPDFWDQVDLENEIDAQAQEGGTVVAYFDALQLMAKSSAVRMEAVGGNLQAVASDLAG
ncbi:hypothetical protein GWK47_045644 [Chionoecetes opilio]|uniref:Uncharacterized protein n=1 Tax=Chionoecetes opilio TaxID=41210 RepID=A0A8J5CWR5_CHIOP|nr:hypothetical protein GWK47_045644 [Chionoecetes opilio]